MITKNDVITIDKDKMPAGRVVGTYTFLRDMGSSLSKNKALQIGVKDVQEAKKIQNRWRSYFKKEAHTRKEVKDDKITVYLWLGK